VVAISCAEPHDAAAILALQRLAYQSEARLYNDWSLPPLTQSLESLVEECATSVVLKAVMSDQIIGSVRAKIINSVCEIGRLVVHPDHQCRGLGSNLLKSIESRFPAASKFELFTGSKSQANIRLYERHGYKVIRNEEITSAISLTFLEKPNSSTL
jgi:ribosomal protein S18 acetylase RimI-like enzyme